MAVKRLFIGTLLPPNIIGSHSQTLRLSFAEHCRGKWVEDHNAHLNYKFLGNVEEERIPEIKEALRPVLRKYNQPLYINHLACIPNVKNPRVLYAQVYSPHKNVYRIFVKTEKICTKQLGFPREKGKFTPHVTLCRLKETGPEFQKVMKDFEEYKVGYLKFYRVNLFASTLSNDGPTYEIV